MKHLPLIAVLALTCNAAQAVEVNAGRAAPQEISSRVRPSDVKAVTSVGPGQAGYVHYFLLTHPDGSLEYQVGIELEDQRVAWSFPNIGVMVSEFIRKGTLDANGMVFKVEHLHGVRPFHRDAQMRVLQKEVTQRVAQWVDNQTPYCLLRERGQPFCLSCGDFVVRILFPGPTPLTPSLPRDFLRVTGPMYTTDDLLLYMVGLHDLPDRAAMLSELAKMHVPAALREDLVAMIGTDDPAATAAPVATAPVTAPIAQKPAAKPAATGRIATRRQQARRL